MMQWVVFSLQEVKSQPQNILMDAIFDDPWTNAYRLELVCSYHHRIVQSFILCILTWIYWNTVLYLQSEFSINSSWLTVTLSEWSRRNVLPHVTWIIRLLLKFCMNIVYHHSPCPWNLCKHLFVHKMLRVISPVKALHSNNLCWQKFCAEIDHKLIGLLIFNLYHVL